MAQGTVLVIDDDAQIRQAVRLTLTKNGYEIVEAGTGHEAIHLLQQSASQITVVLCDLEMPNGSGSEVLKYLTTTHPLIPIIIMTGAPDAVVAEALATHQQHAYLMKPVPPQELLKQVHVATALFHLRAKS
jgi:DNA-binding NtrC family response regulator